MTNEQLLELLQSAEMDLYDLGETIIPRIKITEAIEEVNKRIRRAERLKATA